ncbi:MAG: XRE family transcriptional regulator [Marinifilaceae bacterium]
MLKLNIITDLLSQKNISITDFAKRVGLTPQTVKRIIKNNSTRIQTLERIAQELEMPISSFFSKDKNTVEEPKPHIPVAAQAGTLGSYSNPYSKNECEHYHTIPGFPKYDFTITVQGNSMLPEFHDGDIIACKFITTLQDVAPQQNYIIDSSEGIVLKQIDISEHCLKNEYIRCISLNTDYKEFNLNLSEIYSIAKVIGAIKNY